MWPIADLGMEVLCHDAFSDESVKKGKPLLQQTRRDSKQIKSVFDFAKKYTYLSSCETHVWFGHFCMCLYVCISVWAQRHRWTGHRFGRQGVKKFQCFALLSSPVFTQLWGSCLAHWPRHQAIQDQLRGEKTLTHFNWVENTGTGTKK